MSRRTWSIPRPPGGGGLDALNLKLETFEPGVRFYRVQPMAQREAFHFGHNPDNRMSSEHEPPRHRECYAALKSDVAVHETVFWNPLECDFFEHELEGREVTQFTATRRLQVLRLEEQACSALGIDISIFTARDVALSRAWASALHEWRGGCIEALAFPTRTGGGKAIALFGRTESALRSLPERTPLLHWRNRHGESLRDIVECRLNGFWHPK